GRDAEADARVGRDALVEIRHADHDVVDTRQHGSPSRGVCYTAPSSAAQGRTVMVDYILVEKTQGVAILTLNRPEQLNAMNAQLREAVQRMSSEDEIGCIVIPGAGNRAFSAGGDIHEQRENDRRYTQAELDARTDIRMRGSYEISACPKPTIGMINGLAYG